MRLLTSWMGGAALLALATAQAAAQSPVVPALTTGVLAALCGARGTDAESTTAAGYCRGFLVGVGQYHVEISRPGGIRPAFCLPEAAPTLEVAQASFVAWAAAHPQHRDDKAVDGLLRWAAATYPCAAPAPRRAGQR
jgi:hypothetical protein